MTKLCKYKKKKEAVEQQQRNGKINKTQVRNVHEKKLDDEQQAKQEESQDSVIHVATSSRSVNGRCHFWVFWL